MNTIILGIAFYGALASAPIIGVRHLMKKQTFSSYGEFSLIVLVAAAIIGGIAGAEGGTGVIFGILFGVFNSIIILGLLYLPVLAADILNLIPSEPKEADLTHTHNPPNITHSHPHESLHTHNF